MEPPIEPDASPDAVGGSEEAPKKKKGAMLPMILFVVALVAGGAGAFVMYEKLVAAATGTDLSAGTETTQMVEYGVFHEISGLIVNPAESMGKRYLMVSMGLEVANEGTIADLEEKDIVIRDRVLKLLGSHNADELADIGVREQLKEELLSGLNTLLGEDAIKRLYFTQYVLQ
jgi:flagellar FliL protein